MVITDVNQVVYQGDGVTTAFPFTFRIIDATDIRLLLIDADGTETDIQSNYFVDTVNNTVHYPGSAPGAEPPEADQPAPVQTGQRLVIYRELPITQEKDLGDKWPFFVIELALDKLTMTLQQIYGWWGRTLKFGVGWQVDHPGFDATIPVEAGKTWRVNDAGTGFVATGNPDEAVVVANNAKDVADAAALVADGAKTTAQEAKAVADDAKDVADGAKTTAQEAKDIAQEAKAVADDAKDVADGAKTTAQEAKAVADDAKDVAAGAKTTAEGIAGTAQEAKDIAQDAKAVADDAKDIAAEAKTTAEGIAAGGGGTVTVDDELSDTSTNPVQNKVVKMNLDALANGLGAVSNQIPTKVSALENDAGYLTQHQSLDDYAKKNAANVWAMQQTFKSVVLEIEKYASSLLPVLPGRSDTPRISVMHYIAAGAFTLDLSMIAANLEVSKSTVFTAYIESSADHPLSITNAGTLKYIGAASDVAITSAGLLLNILLTKDANRPVISIVQASKLS